MIQKEQFDRELSEFNLSFKEKYTPNRIDLLYGELNWLCPTELKKVFVELLKRHNATDLPSVQEVKIIAHRVAPGAIKLDDYETNLRVM